MDQDQESDAAEKPDLDAQESRDVRERQSLRSPVIYEVVRREGEEELARPPVSLWWSGLAAGFGISLSLIVQGTMHVALPDTDWRPLVSALGYTTGFVIVILGRLQLFTENTITAVLPLLADRSPETLFRMLRLWGVVFAANMTGTFCVASLAIFVDGLPPGIVVGMFEISGKLLESGWVALLLHGIPAGFLVASIVWLLPSATHNALGIVVLMTWAIAASGFTHVVAGSLDVWLLLLDGQTGVVHAVGGMLLPILLGNVVGGTGLFALVAYAQVREEIEADAPGARRTGPEND